MSNPCSFSLCCWIRVCSAVPDDGFCHVGTAERTGRDSAV
jgi:hypothetical protein